MIKQGRLDYDLSYRSYSRGNGSRYSYYNRQSQKVSLISLQLARESRLYTGEHSRWVFLLGPVLTYNGIRDSRGSYGEYRFSGYTEDSLGQWTSEPATQSDLELTSSSPRSLKTFTLAWVLGLNLAVKVNDKVSITSGVQGTIGLQNIIGNVGQGEAQILSYHGNIGLRYALKNSSLEGP